MLPRFINNMVFSRALRGHVYCHVHCFSGYSFANISDMTLRLFLKSAPGKDEQELFRCLHCMCHAAPAHVATSGCQFGFSFYFATTRDWLFPIGTRNLFT